MTMSGYLTALSSRYDHLRGENFDWGSPDHAMRVVLAYLVACERRMGTDPTGETRALAAATGLDAGDAALSTPGGSAGLQDEVLFLHQTASPVARLLLQAGDMARVPSDARRALLNAEIAELDDFLAALQTILNPPEQSGSDGVSAGAGAVVVVSTAEVERIAASSQLLDTLSVTAVTPISGGMSKITNSCALTSGDGTASNVIMRIDTSAGYSKSSVLDEFGILERLHAGGVAVPKPLAAGRLASGAAAILVSQEKGAMFGTPFHSMLQSQSLCRQMGAHLASIHRVDTQGMALPGAGDSPKLGVVTDIAFIEENWRRIDKPDIVIECALDWLKANIHLADGEARLVHGDYGAHNLLQEDGVVQAVLDWEFAKVGNPVEDLGFVRPVAEQVDSWATFMDGYIGAGGRRPTDEQLNFFVILGLTRLAIMMAQSHDIFRRHGIFRAGVPGAFLQPQLLADLGKLILAQGQKP